MQPPWAELRGIIFDMDGTLVDSRLDFHAMRSEMGLLQGLPILEQFGDLSEPEQSRCWEILHRHEWAGAENATLIDGALALLEQLAGHSLPMAILTRNGRNAAKHTLERLQIDNFFDVVIAREDGPHKPDPWAINEICRRWEMEPAEVVMIGDFVLDIETAINAGSPSILFLEGETIADQPGIEQATHCISHLSELNVLLAAGR